MRPSNILKGFFAFLIVSSAASLMAQQPAINYWRPWDQNGVNVFETTKDEVEEFEGTKVRIGGAFTQQYQSLSHTNNADEKLNADGRNLNELYPLGPGFNLATANLNVDVQLGDGIRLALENYMSSRHHSEFWVKGGYIQFDKLPFLGNPQFFSDYITLKVGHMEVNYGDQHFRRTDNGNSFFNPFVGNTIMDAFATEIGGEAYFKHPSGIIAMFGMSAGLINGDVRDYGDPDNEKGQYTKGPSIYGKLAFDKQLSDDFRLRLSASHYRNNNTIRNTLYAGDRTGSRFYLPMENVLASAGSQFTSGRFNPNFRNQISATMINALVKFGGIELFGTYEMSSGRAGADDETTNPRRSFNQLSAELTYRFLSNEQLFVAGRYNTAFGTSDLKDANGDFIDVSINRIEAALGWYVTKNLLAKVAYVTQDYVDFPSSDIRAEGNFNGIMIEAAVGF
jgi:hypothetical protein